MIRPFLLGLGALIALGLGVAPAAAAESDSFVLRAGRILTMTGGASDVIENGMIIVRDGRIEAVGVGLDVPLDLPQIHLPDATVIPGLVAAESSLAGSHRGEESVAAGFRAVDAFNRYGDYRAILASGVTTVHLQPGKHRLLPGQGAVVKLAGPPEARVLRSQDELCVVLGDGVFAPPIDTRVTAPTSSDQDIDRAREQRPESRLGQLLALREQVESALAGTSDSELMFHATELARLWRNNARLRVDADRAVDLLAAVSFLRAQGRSGYLVGGAEMASVAGSLRRAGLPLVYRPRSGFETEGGDVGTSPDALDGNLRDLLELSSLPWALSPPLDEPVTRLRLLAVHAHGVGLERQRVLAAVTRTAAEILGVSNRVGRLAPGLDADLVVMSGDPLGVATHVQRVYVSGRLEFQAPPSNALVVRAGTVWVSPDQQFANGEVLVEDGKIVAVGTSVPHPPGAQVVDAGADGFVAPGFIDAHGHLGLEGDRSVGVAGHDLTKLLGVPDVSQQRVARAGVTTVLQAPYRFPRNGTRVAAVKTSGKGRDERVVEPVAAVVFDLGTTDPSAIAKSIDTRLAAGRKYVDRWRKYEKKLKEYEEKKKRGEKVDQEVEEVTEKRGPDPITGTWEGTITGGPMPEPQTGRVAFRLTGSSVEGRVIDPVIDIPHRILLTLSGDSLTGQIEVDVPQLPSPPEVEARLVGEDRMEGTVRVLTFVVRFEGKRVDKEAVEFRVTRRKSSGKDGRPVAPRLDPSLEPVRALLEKRIPALVRVNNAAQIDALLDHMVDKLQLPVILLDAPDARLHASRLRDKKIGVVLSTEVTRSVQRREYVAAADLSRHGVMVAFQSRAEDGARNLPQQALHSVERGMAADHALAALTTGAAKLFGIDSRVGSLEPGKDADLVIFRGHPFRTGASVQRVWINGQEVTQ